MKEAVTWYGKYLDECDDPKLEIALGDMYYRGTGTDRDYGRAMDFYQMAYLDPDAQYRLGNMYRRGHTRNGEPWYFEAYEQYEKAAEQGYAEAQYFLSMLYRSGLGVKKDYERAQLWLERALDNGSWHARKFFKGCRNITDKIMEV